MPKLVYFLTERFTIPTLINIYDVGSTPPPQASTFSMSPSLMSFQFSTRQSINNPTFHSRSVDSSIIIRQAAMCPYVRYISQTCSIAIHVQLRSLEIANRYAEWSTTEVIYFDHISLHRIGRIFEMEKLPGTVLHSLRTIMETQVNKSIVEQSLDDQFKKVLAFSWLNFRSLESVWGP